MAVATAKVYAEQEWNLILAARNPTELDRIKADLLVRYSVEIETVTFEATDFSRHRNFISGLKHEPSVSILFFGTLGNHQQAIENWEESRQILDVNFTGAASILHELANYYKKKGSGTIVGVSSVAGERGRQSNYVYGSAKAGLTAYLSGLRNRLYKFGVHVVTVKPGFVDTKMTADIDTPKPLTASPMQVAKSIYKAVAKKRDVIYVLPAWSLIMKNIKLIPEAIFKKMSL